MEDKNLFYDIEVMLDIIKKLENGEELTDEEVELYEIYRKMLEKKIKSLKK